MRSLISFALALFLALWPALAPAQHGAPLANPSLQPPPEGAVLVTLSATGEDLELTEGAPGLTIEVLLENRTGHDLGDLEIAAPLPAHSRIDESWAGEPEANPGRIDGDWIKWDGLTIEEGERLGPFVYRVVPDGASDGAIIFREAAIQVELAWTEPSAGRATSGPLPLNGLWGEGGLRRTVLPSGLTIFTRERPDTSTVALRVAVRAGSRDEDATTLGGSHWLEHAFFLGTARRSVDEIDGAISAVGGFANASTGWDHTDYYNLVPAEHFELALDVLADQLLNSTFPRDAFERERRVVFEELKQRNDAPSVRAFDEFIALVFQVSPLRQHPSGTIESVQSIPIETILAYRDARYVTGNMAIAVSGSITHDAAVARIAEAFAGLPVGERSDRPSIAEPVQAEPRGLRIGDGTRLAEVRLGWPTPGDDHADSAALYVLDDILGATGRRLSEEIRDRRALATSVGVDYLAFHDAGALLLAATTQPDRADAVVELMLAEIERLRDGEVSEDDLRASLRAIAGRRALSDEPNLAQTGRATIEVSGVLDSSEEYQARLRAVTPEDVQRVAQQYLDPGNYTLVLVTT